MDFSNLVGTVGHNYSLDTRNDEFTIIIPHRGDPLGLWATIHACESEIIQGEYKYSYVIVFNGEETVPENTLFLKDGLERQDKLGAFIHSKSPLAPPVARQQGADAATGKYLFFFDNHCIPTNCYFYKAMSRMNDYGMDMLHSTTQYWSGRHFNYHYPLTLEDNFWVTTIAEEPLKQEPYRIACGGAGGFVIKKQALSDVGGFGSMELFDGWGGEETYFDLKMAMFAKSVWLDPHLLHWHYSSTRVYARHNTPQFYTNLMVAAYVLGGDAWLDKVSSSFAPNVDDISSLKGIARSRGAQHREWIKSNAKYTLDEVLLQFKRDGIAH